MLYDRNQIAFQKNDDYNDDDDNFDDDADDGEGREVFFYSKPNIFQYHLFMRN